MVVHLYTICIYLYHTYIRETNDVAVKIFTNVNKREKEKTQQISSFRTSSIVIHQTSLIEMKSDFNLDEQLYHSIISEIELTAQLPYHPNIVRVLGFIRKPLAICTEYMYGGNCAQLVYENILHES